jgi:hypothetical protein
MVLNFLKPATRVSDLPIVTQGLKRLSSELQRDPSVPVLPGTHLRVPKSELSFERRQDKLYFSNQTQEALKKRFEEYGAFYLLLPRQQVKPYEVEGLREQAQGIGNSINNTSTPYILPKAAGKNKVDRAATAWHTDGIESQQWERSTAALLYYPKRNTQQPTGHFFVRPTSIYTLGNWGKLPKESPDYLIPTGRNFYTLPVFAQQLYHHRGSVRQPIDSSQDMVHGLTASFYRD